MLALFEFISLHCYFDAKKQKNLVSGAKSLFLLHDINVYSRFPNFQNGNWYILLCHGYNPLHAKHTTYVSKF